MQVTAGVRLDKRPSPNLSAVKRQLGSAVTLARIRQLKHALPAGMAVAFAYLLYTDLTLVKEAATAPN
jgi:hypothetical protein